MNRNTRLSKVVPQWKDDYIGFRWQTPLASKTLRGECPRARKLRPSQTLASDGSAEQIGDGSRQGDAPQFAGIVNPGKIVRATGLEAGG